MEDVLLNYSPIIHQFPKTITLCKELSASDSDSCIFVQKSEGTD